MSQFFQVSGDIHGGLSAAVNPADTAGGEHFDARHGGDDHGGGDGGGAVLTPCHDRRQVAAAGLLNAQACLAQVLDLLLLKARAELAADDRDGGRFGPVLTGDPLTVQRGLDVLRVRHAMADDGAFQRDDRTSIFQRFFYFFGNIQVLHMIFLSGTLLMAAIRLRCS